MCYSPSVWQSSRMARRWFLPVLLLLFLKCLQVLSKSFFPLLGEWFSSLETFLSPSPDALCLQKIAHYCSTFPKSSLEKERQIQLSPQTCYTAFLPSTSVSIAFWLCREKGAKIHHKNTIPFQIVTAQTGLICPIWSMEVSPIPCFFALCWLQWFQLSY